jgi:hypothetical protein
MHFDSPYHAIHTAVPVETCRAGKEGIERSDLDAIVGSNREQHVFLLILIPNFYFHHGL